MKSYGEIIMPLFGPPDVKKLREKGDVKGLIKAIGYDKGYSRVSSEAADALSEINDPKALDSLLNALNDSNAKVRASAAYALGNIGDLKSVEPLIVALNDSEPKVCASAAVSLGKLGDLKAVDPLIIAIKSSASEDVRSCAAEVLGELNDPKAIESLTVALKDKNTYVRISADRALDKMGWVPDNDEIAAYYWISKHDFKKCIAMGAPAVGPLIFTIRNNENLRSYAEEALSKITDPNSIEQLIAALEEPNFYIRKSAADALGNIKDPRAVEPLIKALKNSDCSIRIKAAVSLGEIGDARALEPLTVALKDQDIGVRRCAYRALDRMGWVPSNDEISVYYWMTKGNYDKCITIGTPAVDPLIFNLNNSDRSDQIGSVRALGEIGDSKAVDTLISTLKSSNSDISAHVAKTLGKIGSLRSVEALIVALKSSDSNLREKAAEALGEIGDPRAIEPLTVALEDRHPWVRQSAAEALDKISIIRSDKSVTITTNEAIADRKISPGESGNIVVISLVKKVLDTSELVFIEDRDKYAQNIITEGEEGITTLINCLNDAYQIRAGWMHHLVAISIIIANKTKNPELISLLIKMKESGDRLVIGTPKKILWMPELKPEIIGSGQYGWQTLPDNLSLYNP